MVGVCLKRTMEGVYDVRIEESVELCSGRDDDTGVPADGGWPGRIAVAGCGTERREA